MAGKIAALSVDIKPTPKAGEAVSLLAQAKLLTVTDRSSHVACLEVLKGAKALKREIEAHYEAIKKPLNAARNTVLQMEKDHLAPIEQAIAVLERVATGYAREQQRLEREAEERARREAEEKERQRRAAEQAEAEAAALKLEESSESLSAREAAVVTHLLRLAEPWTPNDWVRAAKLAGYQDATASAKRLLASSKLQAAIMDAKKAEAIRREAIAKSVAPIIVTVPKEESQIGKLAGTSMRTYYSCGAVDLPALVLAVAENIKSGDGTMIQALQANEVYLNQQARSLKEMFPRVWPMCQLGKEEGVAG